VTPKFSMSFKHDDRRWTSLKINADIVQLRTYFLDQELIS